MKKVIGIVSEGPTDHMVLKAAIDSITGEENRYLSLQPEQDMMGRFGNGWKDPWKNVIARKKHYHGIRVRDKKNTTTYKIFSDKVVDQWSAVTEKCNTAMLFEREIKRILMDGERIDA